MSDGSLPVQFVAREQQREVISLGMWIFLGTELMMFGAVFAAYTVYRIWFHELWPGASAQLDLKLGTLNTAILLTSSLCMALADLSVERRARLRTLALLLATALLGAVFLGIKFYEYSKEFHHQLVPLAWLDFHYVGLGPDPAQMFFNFYFVMTGMHAVHLTAGVLLVLFQAVYVWRWRKPEMMERRLKVTGLYWHFVDIIWVFLYPMLYLL